MRKTFKQFLVEKVTHAISADDVDTETIKSLLEKRCSKILSAYRTGRTMLYRGIRSEDKSSFFISFQPQDREDNDFVLGKSRTDRKSVDINKRNNDLLHDVFLKLGLKATRKNSIFTTSVKNSAKDWGILYIIFPFDNANITWIDLDKIDHEYPYYVLIDILDDFTHVMDKERSEEDYVAREIKNRLKPVKNDLTSALKKRNVEVLINGDYYGIKVNSKLWTKEIKPWLKAQ